MSDDRIITSSTAIWEGQLLSAVVWEVPVVAPHRPVYGWKLALFGSEYDGMDEYLDGGYAGAVSLAKAAAFACARRSDTELGDWIDHDPVMR